jgi:hypothetical protein
MEEMSKQGWLIGLVKHAIWSDSLYFLYLLFSSFYNTGRWIKSKEISNLSVLHHRQNPLQSTCSIM